MVNNNPPVVLFLYQRPHTTLKLLNLIVNSGTNKIYLYLDGPKNKDQQKITNNIKHIISKFIVSHPDIQFVTHFARKNKGLKQSIVTGLNQVFKREQSAIILEDDCIPHPDFFIFTKTMLSRYKDNTHIMSIAGTGIKNNHEHSYDYSKYQLCWGWATWARAWDLYDVNISSYNLHDKVWFKQIWKRNIMQWYWHTALYMIKLGQINTWDYQWSYAHFKYGGLAIIPSVNLVTNIGFDNLATHTKIKSKNSNLPIHSLNLPLKHPQKIVENLTLSSNIEQNFYKTPTVLLSILFHQFKSLVKGNYVT